jgi:sodium-independent sulfate anion transporter 11
MGIAGINTRGATYRVLIDTLKALPNTKLDAALGLTALVLLYGIRSFCNFMAKKMPSQKKLWFFVSTVRISFTILLYVLISYLVNRHVKTASKAKFKILGVVPSGRLTISMTYKFRIF